MRVYTCQNPLVITNQYTRQKVVAPCGRCPACLDAKAALWVQRLEQEQYFSKYTWFVTLQFDEQHVNQFIRLRKEDCDNDDILYIDSSTGQIIDFSDPSTLPREKKDYTFCYETKVLLVHNFKDFQDFIKLLRYYAKNRFNANFRYWITCEYGPSTFRPHAHCQFFFNSSELHQGFRELLTFCWKHGNVYDPHPTSGSAASYVASYVNQFTHLPSILRHKAIRQRALFSKRPPIGACQFSEAKIKEIFLSAACEIRLFSPTKSKFVDVPMWRYLQDRLFPRCQRYNVLSPYDRKQLYTTVLEFLAVSRVDGCEFTSHNFARYLCFRYILWNRGNKCFIRDYFSDVCFDSKKIVAISDDWTLISRYYGSYIHTTQKFDDYVRTFNYDSLLRFARIVMRVYLNSVRFNVTLGFYLNQIELYYENEYKLKIQRWYQFQDDYFKEHDVKEFLCFDADFINLCNNKERKDIPAWCLFYLDEYNYNVGSDGVYHLSLCYVFDYNDLCKTHDYINWQNTKTKKQNDYLLKNSSKFQNVLNYYESK